MSPAAAGHDLQDATTSKVAVPDFALGLAPADQLSSQPLKGQRLGIIRESMAHSVTAPVLEAISQAARHLESLGAEISEVRGWRFGAFCLPVHQVGCQACEGRAFEVQGWACWPEKALSPALGCHASGWPWGSLV